METTEVPLWAPGELDEPRRRQDLDGLRGVAVLLTIFLHYVSRGVYFRSYFPYLGPKPVALFLDSFWSGVDIFFVLSGFLIGGIILDNRRAENFLRVFFLRRALRILPVALLAIAFSYLILPIFYPSRPQDMQTPLYAYLLFINNFWTASGAAPYPPLGPMWSLAIEQQFYLIAPAFILLTAARVRNVALLIIVFISPVLRSYNLGFSSWDFTPLRLDGVSSGILVAVLLRDARFLRLATRNPKTSNSIAIGLMVVAPLFSSLPELPFRDRIAFGISLNSLAATGGILFLQLNRGSILSRVLSRPWLVASGRLSYFLYLMHVPIMMYVTSAGLPGLTPLPVALCITLVCAWLSWRFLESPLIDIGKNFPYSRSHIPEPTDSVRQTLG
jgi:peptidoglycan/LPS O-acetylase OafA/YrhL